MFNAIRKIAVKVAAAGAALGASAMSFAASTGVDITAAQASVDAAAGKGVDMGTTVIAGVALLVGIGIVIAVIRKI
jgi:hypothetical protein